MKTEITHSANTTQQQPTICTIKKKKKVSQPRRTTEKHRT